MNSKLTKFEEFCYHDMGATWTSPYHTAMDWLEFKGTPMIGCKPSKISATVVAIRKACERLVEKGLAERSGMYNFLLYRQKRIKPGVDLLLDTQSLPLKHRPNEVERPIPYAMPNVKITFGLQPHHIDAIEAELKRWSEMPPTSDGEKVDPKYIEHVWRELGKKLGWAPFTLALYYFEYLEGKNQNTSS